MADPIRAKSKILLAKAEDVYGTDPTPTGAANAILAIGFELLPMEGDDLSRELEFPWLGGQEEFPVALRAVLSFSTEFAASGSTGVAPAWGPLARACGLAELVTPDNDPGDGTVIYTPVTNDHESVTLHFHIGPTRHVFLGARGTCVIQANAQGIPRARWTLTGIWVPPAAEAAPVPDYAAFQRPVVVSHQATPAFTVDAVPLVMRSFSLDLGRRVEPRFLVGRHEIMIVDMAEQMSFTVEATPLATFDPFALAAPPATMVPITLSHGTVAGHRIAIEAPTSQVRRPGRHLENQNIQEWPLIARPLPDQGDDQLTITLT